MTNAYFEKLMTLTKGLRMDAENVDKVKDRITASKILFLIGYVEALQILEPTAIYDEVRYGIPKIDEKHLNKKDSRTRPKIAKTKNSLS